jgi:hypothetical protein
MARPTKYKSQYNLQSIKLCRLGATDKELADFFEVDESTINEWKEVYPQFSLSIKKGKEFADAEVADKLFKRATGYKHPDVDIKQHEGAIIITKLTKHYPPDTAAAIFWLKNRQKGKWRDKQDIEMNATLKSVTVEYSDSLTKDSYTSSGATSSPEDKETV